MNISRLRIENFRCIKSLEVDLNDTTVLIGQNNAGKSAILDAIRIVLTRRWGQRGTGFSEYDVHLANAGDDPKTAPPVLIEIRVEESQSGEWPDTVHRALDKIKQLDPASGITSITLRVRCSWNPDEGCFEPIWEFLNVLRQPLIGREARVLNLHPFFKYLPVFYLSALRDANDEFSSKSQFWGRLLKAMVIPPELEADIQEDLDALNARLLEADPRLAKIAVTLRGATTIAARDREGDVNLRVTPLQSWDLLSKTGIVLKNEPDWPWLPLDRHGQGMQSLSVLFLFQAFVDHLLSALYEPESSAVLALEEPETHLHPQAARALWHHVSGLSGQKIITTHSPYFVQKMPLRDLRLVTLTDKGTVVRWLPAHFKAIVPPSDQLQPIVAGSNGMLTYVLATQELAAHRAVDTQTYRSLLTAYAGHPEQVQIHNTLRDLRDRSILHIPDEDLGKLRTFASRIRGEIFFARRWMIVEGQSEYLIVDALASALDYSLDEHGVALIDSVNNGSPAIFATLARALGIPWTSVLDNDEAGLRSKRSMQLRGFSDEFLESHCRLHPAGNMEDQLIADGLEPELRAALVSVEVPGADNMDLADLRVILQADTNKVRYAAYIADNLYGDAALAARMPAAFRDAITSLRGLD